MEETAVGSSAEQAVLVRRSHTIISPLLRLGRARQAHVGSARPFMGQLEERSARSSRGMPWKTVECRGMQPPVSPVAC